MSILGIGLIMLQVQLATASGTVTKPGSNEPLPGATVLLMPSTVESLNRGASQNPRIRFAVSEDDGRFTIQDIEPGQYRLQAQSPLYGAVAYGQRRPDGPGTVLSITAGQRLSDLKISMVPTGTITGRITGSSGEPLAQATVQALKYSYLDGKRTLNVAQTTTTDERGEYRLFWLYSGKYVVVANAPNGPIIPGDTTPPMRPGGTVLTSDMPFRGPLVLALPQIPGAQLEGTNLVKRILEDGTFREESWMPTYYPATTDRSQATSVEVVAGSATGSTVTGINIMLGPSPVQKIRGRVTGGTEVTVTLAPVNQGPIARGTNTNASPSDGAFEFAGVAPGAYTLTAQNRSGLIAAPVAVLVANRDVENLGIAVAPGMMISAQIKIEGAGAPDNLSNLTGILRQDSGQSIRTTLRQPNALAGPGGVMTWVMVTPGTYQLSIQQPVLRENQKPLYIKSIRFAGEDALDSIRVRSDTTGVIDVVLGTETGSVEGTAIGRNGDTAGNVTIALIPATARKRTDLYKTLVTGGDGKLRFQEIPPGDYKLFAWDDIESGAWQDTEFMAPYESRGRAVHVTENNKEEVQLNVIYNP